MSFSWPLDKLAVINSVLALTGDNPIATENDGSDEWSCASSAYDTAIAYIAESHSWSFATQVITLQPSPTPPQDTAWDTAFPIPTDCVHLIWIKINQFENDTPASSTPMPCLYDIAGTQQGPVILVNAQGGPPPPQPPVTPAIVTMKYVSNSGGFLDSQSGTPTFVLSLKTLVMSGIYRGLHEDVGEAEKTWMAGERILQMARTRYDQQKPKRQFFNSRITASRRIRRPWPPIGIDGWSGSNTPGVG